MFQTPDDADGVVAVGPVPTATLIKEAYGQGIFPWPSDPSEPTPWVCPDPRFVLMLDEAHIPGSLRKTMKKTKLEIRADTAFEAVIRGCAQKQRPDQDGSWITEKMQEAYTALHYEGLAHSVEAWDGGTLCGGLYGVSFGKVFFGESMFQTIPDASKIAFATLMANLKQNGILFIDCQAPTDHLARFGARNMPRDEFLARLQVCVSSSNWLGPWKLTITPAQAVEIIRPQAKE